MKNENSQIVANIKAAFANRPTPSGQLFSSEFISNADKIFFSTPWNKMSSEKVEYYSESLHFLNNDAFCYYLPAFLLAAIERPESYPTQILLGKLIPPKNDVNRPSFNNWWSKLCLQEKQVTIDFLNCIEGDLAFGDINSTVSILLKTIE